MTLSKLFYKPLFLERQVDEIALEQNSQNWLDQNNFNLDINIFSQLHHQVSLNQATNILHQYLTHKNQSFIELIKKIPTSQFNNKKRIKIIIVPGMYYKQHPEIGADGRLFFEIAKKLGFNVVLVNTASLGMISENVLLIEQAIKQSVENEIWLISLSKGSLEVRTYLQQTSKLPDNLSGWVNVAGICYGTLLADFKLTHPARRLLSRSLCKLLGINYAALAELCTYNQAWQKNMFIPAHVTAIHIAALPTASQISAKLQPRYARLSHYGPNDGMILLRDYLRLPGHIYPIWGFDHLMRHPSIGSLIYKLYYFIHQQKYKDIPHEKTISNSSAPAFEFLDSPSSSR